MYYKSDTYTFVLATDSESSINGTQNAKKKIGYISVKSNICSINIQGCSFTTYPGRDAILRQFSY